MLRSQDSDLFRTLPNFLVIGAMKAATSSFHGVLRQHPQIFCTEAKETLFFSDDLRFARGPEWYARTHFRGTESFAARGESTTHYLYCSSKVAPRIATLYSGRPLALLAVFRDPVARAYSHYWWDVSRGYEPRTFEEALSLEPVRLAQNRERFEREGSVRNGYFHGSCYAARLEPFLEHFGRDQFLFLLQEDLGEPFEESMRSVARFLHVDDSFAFRPLHVNPAVRERSHLASEAYDRLSRPFPLKAAIKSLLPAALRKRLRRWGRQWGAEPFSYPLMHPSTQGALRERFAQDVQQLATILQRDLSSWLPS